MKVERNCRFAMKLKNPYFLKAAGAVSFAASIRLLNIL